MKKTAFVSALLTLSVVGTAQAALLNYAYTTTAADGGPGAGITLALQINDENNDTATFTVGGASSSSTAWYAGEFDFKFNSGNSKPNLSGLAAPGALGTWSIADSNENVGVQILGGGGNYSSPLSASAVGFFVTSLAEGGDHDATQGICLTSPCNPSATFTFNIELPLGATYSSTIPIQVRFYDGYNGSSQLVTNQLSRQLTVPDGGTTLLLLGCALIGLGAVRRGLGA